MFSTMNAHNGFRAEPEQCSDGSSEQVSGEETSNVAEENLRRHLKYFFMNPCEKFGVKRKFPWKLCAQLVKIVLVTIQLAVFGFARASHVDFLEKSNIAFRHLYLNKWDPSFETMPYPPATGAYAVYTIPEFFKSVDYALSRYNQTEEIAIGTYHFNHPNDSMPPMEMCKVHYKKGKIYAYNHTYIFDAKTVKECFELFPVEVHNNTSNETKYIYDTKRFLEENNQTLNFDRLIRLELRFAVSTIHLKKMTKVNTPDCYIFNITITFENYEHNGQMLIDLTSTANSLRCSGTIDYDNDTEMVVAIYVIFDVVVLLLCIISIILCFRSIVKAQHLRKETQQFFQDHRRKNLDIWDKLEFLNLWYVMIIVNDFMIIIASAFKIRIELKEYHNYEACGLLLGIGNLLVWFGVLRYLKFFDAYNILILTMKKSAPNIFRFLVCASVFYFGFTVCGWVVLGPYHIKFRTISTTSECLFSLVNGDDMFVTFSVINDGKHTPGYVWYFSRIYLYTFISMFIYVVLNLFIAVILDTYEVLKEYHNTGFPKSEMHMFIDKPLEDGHVGLFRHYHTGGCCAMASLNCLSHCCDRESEQSLSVQADDMQDNLVT